MDLSNIIQFFVTSFVTFLVTFVFLRKIASSLTLETKDEVVIYNEDDSIILNCTYHKNDSEEISDRNIQWKKQIGTSLKGVATFSPPGGPEPFIERDMKSFYINRTELIAPDSYLAAVFIINKPLCSDEGIYQCWIQYYIKESTNEITSTSKVAIKAPTKAKEPIEFRVFPETPEENQSITLICNADVGNPRGNIDIWKKFQNSNTPDKLVYTSNSSNSKAESCIEYANVSLPVTRDDNGVLFRCSSQNNFTQDPGPSRDSSEITVIYGPDKPTITLTPHKTMYSIGDHLTLQCITDSNPPPVFTWSFRPYNKSEEMPIEHAYKSANLVFNSFQTKNAGIYTCAVINTARPGYPIMTSLVSISVNNSERIKSVCDQCGYIETCQQTSEKTVCSVNIWMPIAVVCILLSSAFAVSSTVMIMQRKRTQEKTATNNILIENRSPPPDATPEEIHGGYISPADLEFGVLPPSVTQEGNGAAYSRL